ncbi:MAG: DUF4259 domain-containing protein [Bacteroidota bacterium]|nr:DUF4259 domain-containing protein [Bacteroidota bacterium]
MGAWGLKNFENDSALDFTADVLEGSKNLIKNAILKINNANADDYLESDDCVEALAAMEFIATAKGNAPTDLTDDLQKWLKKNDVLQFKSGLFGKKLDMTELSLKALDRISSNSELKELWEESEEFNDWLKIIEDLKQRLG